MHALHDAGLNPTLQAGTLNWPITPPHLDDGVSPTHFSYEFEPEHPLSLLAMATGNLPEMHVWVKLQDTGETIDFTTRFLKEQFSQMTCGLKWRTPEPPNTLWSKKLPLNVLYRPDPRAIEIAHQALKLMKISLPQHPRIQTSRSR